MPELDGLRRSMLDHKTLTETLGARTLDVWTVKRVTVVEKWRSRMNDKELDRLCEIIGSLVIAQFDTQDEYREVINMIFHEFRKEGTEK